MVYLSTGRGVVGTAMGCESADFGFLIQRAKHGHRSQSEAWKWKSRSTDGFTANEVALKFR